MQYTHIDTDREERLPHTILIDEIEVTPSTWLHLRYDPRDKTMWVYAYLIMKEQRERKEPMNEQQQGDNQKRGPKRSVTFDGSVYKVRRNSNAIPDLTEMDRTQALLWLIKYTYPRGYSKAPSPLQGISGAINVVVSE